MLSIAEDWDQIGPSLAGTARRIERNGRPTVIDTYAAASLDRPEARRIAFTWLAERVNTFVNVLRPRIRSAVIDYRARGE